MTTELFDAGDDTGEPLDDGATWLLDLVAAVDHLRRGYRPGLTVWDALEEALRWTLPDLDRDDDWDTPDPLAHALERVLAEADSPVASSVQAAVRRWVTVTAERCNGGHHWPHPQPRRGFPPPMLAVPKGDGSG